MPASQYSLSVNSLSLLYQSLITKSQEGSNAIYQSKLAWEYLQWISLPIPVLLRHEREGPIFEVCCRKFEAASPEQTRLYYKHGNGWKPIESTPFALVRHEVEGLDEYVSGYTILYLTKLVNERSLLSQVFAEAERNMKVSAPSEEFTTTLKFPSFQDPLMWLALRLWAANRLLMKGWEIGGHETLGMYRVTNESSSLFGTIPAPRVLQNQLDRNLELYIARTELEFLRVLQNAMLQTRPQTWIVVFTAVVITLHMRERDIWRLEHWVLNPDVVSLPPYNPNFPLTNTKSYQWRHPDTAATLIQRSVHLSNLLLNHLHFSGVVPRKFFNIEEAVKMQQKANSRYSWIDERSIDFSLCSLAFETSDSKHLRLAKSEDFGC